jgi:formate dehydrogenase major subunit
LRIGYATHPDRILKPMIRAKISDPWREVSWDEAIGYAASEFKRIPGQVRARFDRRNHLVALHERGNLSRAETGAAPVSATTTSTPARVSCHSPTGYGLKQTRWANPPARRFRFGHAGRRDHRYRAYPTDGHPVFASQMKRTPAPQAPS